MPRYTFSCTQCGYQDIDYTEDFMHIGHHHGTCPLCGGRMKRAASFYYTAPMREHFNVTIGKRVGNRREWKDGIKRAEEEQSIRTGVTAKYVEVDMGEPKALGVTEEGLETKFKQIEQAGRKPPKVR